MKLIKYGFGILLSVLLVSCASKWPEYTVTNEDVSWESSGTTYGLSADETPITITIQRGIATEAVSVPFTFNDTEGVYTVSASKVDFAVGEYSKTITLSYDYSTLTPGTEYTFTLAFDKSLAGDGSFYEFNGNGMMALQYEDYLTGTYPYTYAYGGGLHIWRMGAFLEELDGTEVKLELAKGTDNYYRVTCFNGMTLEFKSMGDGTIDVAKYTGYNESISQMYSGGEFAIYHKIGGVQYIFDCMGPYSFWEDDSGDLTRVKIQAGDRFFLYAWTAQGGSWMNGGYALYHVLQF